VGSPQAGQQHAGWTNAMIHLVLQQARGHARLCDRREIHASLDRGAKLLELLGQLNMVRCGHRRGKRARCPLRAPLGKPGVADADTG
jgi:hypothetical protein